MQVQVDELTRPNNTVNINFPLTCEFEVSRNTLATCNKGRFTVYNLKPETRKRIFKDRFATDVLRGINFQAGYVGQRPLPYCFRGDIIEAFSYRKGRDWVTVIEANDGIFGVINSQIDKTFPAGTKPQNMIQTLIGSMKNITPGTVETGIGGQAGARGTALSGNIWDIVNRLAGADGTAFIDGGQAHVIDKNSYLPGIRGIATLNSQTGLLNTPRRQETIITVDMLFEPRAVVGQFINVVSLEAINNGVYRVDGVTHRGTISGAVDGGVTTTLSLFAGTKRLKAAA